MVVLYKGVTMSMKYCVVVEVFRSTIAMHSLIHNKLVNIDLFCFLD